MEKVVKEVKSIVDDLDMSMYFDEEQMDNEILYYEGHKDGVAEGHKNEKIEIAQNLIKEKVDYNIISKATGLSKEEIEELEKDS